MNQPDHRRQHRVRPDRHQGSGSPRRRPWARCWLTLVLGGAALPVTMAEPGLAASMPPLPPARQVLYDPDPATCKPASLQSNFQKQLLPWADQPAAVQASLRQLQLEMLQATLQRCVRKGLLTPEQVSSLEQALGLPPGEPPTQPSGARP